MRETLRALVLTPLRVGMNLLLIAASLLAPLFAMIALQIQGPVLTVGVGSALVLVATAWGMPRLIDWIHSSPWGGPWSESVVHGVSIFAVLGLLLLVWPWSIYYGGLFVVGGCVQDYPNHACVPGEALVAWLIVAPPCFLWPPAFALLHARALRREWRRLAVA